LDSVLTPDGNKSKWGNGLITSIDGSYDPNHWDLV
jgi:hypothetical protein